MKDKRTVTFPSIVLRDGADLEVNVTATVYWSSGVDERGYESGYLVEDVEARHAIVPIQLDSKELDDLKGEALEQYLKG